LSIPSMLVLQTPGIDHKNRLPDQARGMHRHPCRSCCHRSVEDPACALEAWGPPHHRREFRAMPKSGPPRP
jgi:hypothetical protein